MSYSEITRVMTKVPCATCQSHLDTDEVKDRKQLSNQCYQCYSDQLTDAQYQNKFGTLPTYAWDDDSDEFI